MSRLLTRKVIEKTIEQEQYMYENRDKAEKHEKFMINEGWTRQEIEDFNGVVYITFVRETIVNKM